MKTTIAKTVVINMVETRNKAPASDLWTAPNRGIIKPSNIKNVSKTAIWAIILLSFFIPGFIPRMAIPKITGIKAVIEGELDVKYPYPPSAIKEIELIKLDW